MAEMKNENNNDVKVVSPYEYFEGIKSKRDTITDEKLKKVYDDCIYLLNKFKATNQEDAMKKVLFHLDTIDKERELIKLGVTTFIYRTDVEHYLDMIDSQVVKLIDVEKYQREIPQEIIDVINKTKGIFDHLFILFTDYTGETERKVEKERREKDPILFGTFYSSRYGACNDRFYYLGDWEDEYCDLTLDKMVGQIKEKTGSNVEMKISTPEDIEELKRQLNLITTPTPTSELTTVQLTNTYVQTIPGTNSTGSTRSLTTGTPSFVFVSNNDNAIKPDKYERYGEDLSEKIKNSKPFFDLFTKFKKVKSIIHGPSKEILNDSEKNGDEN